MPKTGERKCIFLNCLNTNLTEKDVWLPERAGPHDIIPYEQRHKKVFVCGQHMDAFMSLSISKRPNVH